MAVSGSSFVDEIYDQFLVCRMCSEVYNSPKVLSCMHSFCEKCLEAHYDMEEQERPYRFLVYNRALTCPLCHSRTELPTGGIHRLPDNLLVANLSAVVGRCKGSPNSAATVCEICRPGALHNEADAGDERAAVSKCLDCAKLLCGACAELHRKTRVTAHHGLFDVRGGGEGDLDCECKRHQNEALRFYCEECEECVCVLCTFHDHREHDVTSLADALDRHRRPFEALMERCRGRIDGLRAQVELIERCERGLKRAEERIRDAAIDAIAAIRKREKDLLTEIRESLDEQTLGFIGEKGVFKENLRNLEGSFDATNAMLTGTKLDLLIVRKEMEKKLTSILESGLKNTPDLLKRSVHLCCEETEKDDYYPDVVQAAFDRMGKSNRFLGPHRETGRPAVEVQTVATETDPDPEFAPDLISKLDQTDPDASIPDSTGGDSTWRRPMAVVIATDTPRSFGTVTLRAIDGLPRTGDTATQTPRPAGLVDGSTEMPRLVLFEKETNTPFVHVTQKGVSTDNLVMVDRSTSTTLVDVTAAYRGAATTKRSVMVSRGTCTPRTATTDRETLSLPNPISSTARACSPVDWISVSAKSETESLGGNPSILPVAQNYSVDHVTSKSAQENTRTVRSNPAVVGVSNQAAIGVSTSAVVGVSTSAVVGARGVSKTQTQCKQDDLKLFPPSTSSHQPSPVTVTVNIPTPPSAATQARPREGQGSSRGQEVSRNPVPLNQIQVGKVVIEEPANLSKVQLMPAPQGNKDLIRSLPALSGIKGGQLYSQVLGQKGMNGTQIPSTGPEVPFPPGPQSQAPGSVPGSPPVIGNQRSQVPLQGSANVPGVQITPESQRFQVPIASPGTNYMLPTGQGSQVRITGPADVPVVQSIPGTQGSQVRNIGLTNLPGVQSIPGKQGQVRTVGPTNVPGVQSIPGTQDHVRTTGPASVPAAQSIPGIQGSQVRNIGPTNLPGVQSIPGIQSPVRTVGPTNVPGVQFIPGTQGNQVSSVGPTNVPGVQTIPGTQGPVRTVGPTNVPGVQSIPGTQGPVRTVGPTNVPGVQSIPGAQGQVRTVGPTNVPGVQSTPGTQGSHVRTIGPTNVPGTQFVPGAQASQVRSIGPANVPGVQSIPGTQAGQVRTMGANSLPSIQTQASVQSVPGSQAPNSPNENHRYHVISPTATPAKNQDVIVAVATSPEAIATSATEKKTSFEGINRGSNAIEGSRNTDRVPQSFLTSSILAPQTREIIETARKAPLGNAAECHNNPGVSVGSSFVTPVSQIPSQAGVASIARNQMAAQSPNISGFASKLPGSFPVQQKPGGAIIGDEAASPEAPKLSSASTSAEPRNQPRPPGEVAASGNRPPVSTSSPVSRLLVNDTNKSAAEKTTTSGSKPDENPQNPTTSNGSNDQLIP